ncbi:MAG: A/G-specific adenine glycosylase [Planctomycetota bacterium]
MRPFSARLLAWYDGNKRDLPWRRRSDPWAIWVSEVMLQQTRVEAVREAFGRFLSRFPKPEDLASCADDDLQAAWRGLGYYRRAKLLRAGAAEVVRAHGGEVPCDPEALRRLPGIGSYTAGAVASIAFGKTEPAIDGNVERVLSRHEARREPVKSAAMRSFFERFVRTHQPADRPGDFNQALMELGAVICSPRSPSCSDCPVAADCRGRSLGIQNELPSRMPEAKAISVETRLVLAAHGARLLAHRIPEGEVNAGQVELPGPGCLAPCLSADSLRASLLRRFGAKVEIGRELGRARHSITKYRIQCVLHEGRAIRAGKLVEADPRDRGIPWSTLSRKLLRSAEQGD